MSTKRYFYMLVAIVVLVVAACTPQGEPTSAPTAAPAATPKPTSAPTAAPVATPKPTSAPTAAPVASPTLASSERPLPLAYWSLDGDGTASVGDSVLEFSGAYELSDTAVSFDGYTGSASTSAPGPIDTTASFSVSAWVNYADRSAIAAAVSQLGEITGLFHLGVGDENRWWFMMKTDDRTGVEYSVRVQGARAIPGSSWTHLVGVHDREAGMLRLYVNGEEQGEAAFTTPLKAEGPLTIGRGQFDSRPGNFWPGSIGEVAVYQTALNAEQVAEIYQTTKPTSPPPAMPAPDPSTYANGILNGTWDYVMTAEDRALLEAGLEAESGYDADELRIRLGFDNHEWWQGFVFDGELWLLHGVPEGSGGTFTIDGNELTTFGQGSLTTYEWSLEGDSLTTIVVEDCEVSVLDTVCFPTREEIEDAGGPMLFIITEHTWTRSGDKGSY